MRSYNPQTHRETGLKSLVGRAVQKMQAEQEADPEGFAEKSRRSHEDARRFQERAKTGGVR